MFAALVAGLILMSEPPGIVAEASTVEATPIIISTWRYELSLDPILQDLADCESGFDERAINKKDSDGYRKYGLFQYHIPTWEWFVSMMRKAGLIEQDKVMDIFSGADQLKVTQWAFANGYKSHWGVCI